MARPIAQSISLSSKLRGELEAICRRGSAPQVIVARARIVLLAAAGNSNVAVGEMVGVDVKTARRWRARFAASPELDTLRDLPRCGRPCQVAPATRAKLVSLACRRAHDKDKRPFHVVWTQPALQAALLAETGVRLSTSEIGRILRARELRPHRIRMWLHSQDPEFGPKVDRVCSYYVNPPPDVTVLCVDEKRLFAHRRSRELRPARENRASRREFEYSRHGSSVLLAAFDIGTGEVYGECRDRRTGDDLVEFMDQVAAQTPGKVVIIWDNLNVHHEGKANRWTQFNRRHGERFTFVHTPKHASWVNQVEIWFSILERRALRHDSFESVTAVNERAKTFIECWNAHDAHPFNWTFRGTRDWKPKSPWGFHAGASDRSPRSRKSAA